jgi:hypothetical protein
MATRLHRCQEAHIRAWCSSSQARHLPCGHSQLLDHHQAAPGVEAIDRGDRHHISDTAFLQVGAQVRVTAVDLVGRPLAGSCSQAVAIIWWARSGLG